MKANEFVMNATRLIGTPYNTIDCIGVVRIAAGINCQGTNWLWRSINNSPKYRYLIERHDTSLPKTDCMNGILVFRINWSQQPKGYEDTPNCYHVGIITAERTVIHSTEKLGVHEEAYDEKAWNAYGFLKQIDYTGINFKVQEEHESSNEELKDSEKLNEMFEMIKALYDKFITD